MTSQILGLGLVGHVLGLGLVGHGLGLGLVRHGLDFTTGRHSSRQQSKHAISLAPCYFPSVGWINIHDGCYSLSDIRTMTLLILRLTAALTIATTREPAHGK